MTPRLRQARTEFLAAIAGINSGVVDAMLVKADKLLRFDMPSICLGIVLILSQNQYLFKSKKRNVYLV
jgi:hypothetical protein